MADHRTKTSEAEAAPSVSASLGEGLDELSAALADARISPADVAVWDRLEQLAASAQRPEEVARLYRDTLAKDVPPTLAVSLGQRGAAFHEEWFGEDAAELLELLARVLVLDPGNQWAFQRLTVAHTRAGRWDDLLDIYDLAIGAAAEAERRVELLNEAVSVARDFAELPDRAVGYLEQLLATRPDDAELASSLERLLERGERWQDLLDFWSRRLPALSRAEEAAARARIAETYLERLGKADSALAEASTLLAAGIDAGAATRILERVAALEDASLEVRQQALARLRDHYAETGRADDVVRTLEAEIALADRPGRVALHREAGRRLAELGRADRAVAHFAELLRLEPGAIDALLRLRALARQTGDDRTFADALESAAAASEDPATRVGLRMEAARVRASRLADGERAIALYRLVLEEQEADETAPLEACRRLADLLEQAGRREEQLAVLEQLAGIEPETSIRKSVVGRAAALADSLGQTARALDLWWSRIEKNRADVEALDATVEILEREADWKALVGALRQRIAAPLPDAQRRADWVRVARVQADRLEDLEAAVRTWREIADSFGEDSELVDALADLLRRTGAWGELSTLLEGAAARESKHVADMLALLGEACRSELGEPVTAMRCYLRAQRIDPAHEATLVGLTALLEVDECRAGAAEALSEAYEAADRWQDALSLLDWRLEGAPSPAARARLLRQAARTQRDRASDPGAALRSLCRALPLAHDDEDLEADLLALAEQVGEFAGAVEALGAAAEVATTEQRRLALRSREGELAGGRLEDGARALAAYSFVLSAAPARLDAALAVVGAASAAGEWDRAAEAVVASARARGTVEGSLVAALESAARAASALEAAARALDRAVESADELEPETARALDRSIACWFEDLGATEPALRAWARAAARPGEDLATLEALARLQRSDPGPHLFETLTRLAGQRLESDDIDPLHEAARLAVETLGDLALAVPCLERLFREASRIWRAGTRAGGRTPADQATLWSHAELVRLAEAAGDHARAVALLSEAANLPLEAESWREMRRRAARIAAGPAGDPGRAIVLYRSILAEVPDDQAAIRELGDVCEAEGRVPELLALRQHELSLGPEPDRRLRVRLEIAKLVSELAARGGRLEALRANLEERPGHPESIDALVEMLAGDGRFGELTDMLAEQAGRLQRSEGDAERAAALWARVAELAEQRLGDPARAIHAHAQAADLVGSTVALDALARLHTERKEPKAASRWLARRLQVTEGPERVEIAMRLARARLDSDQADKAVAVLEAVLEEQPRAAALREMLAAQYRAVEALEPLARLLTAAAPHLEDAATLCAFAKEAAGLYRRLGSPDRAVLVLERAAAAVPDDPEIRLLLADGLLAADRLDEAEGLVAELVETYGRRRSPERAALHHRLARVKKARGDLGGALEQLELASSMDMQNTAITGMLAELSREAGQLDKAERTYRALLMVVRRAEPEDEDTIGAAEVFFELSRLARERGQQDQADELERLSLKTASASAAEMRRFKKAMLQRGAPEALLRALEMRAEAVSRDQPALAAVLADRADVLESASGQAEQALEALLGAIDAAPERSDLHERARALAGRTGRAALYADKLRSRAEAVRRRDDAVLATDLLGRLGAVLEEDLGALDEALDAYSRMEGWGVRPAEARLAMARVAAAKGDPQTAGRLLERVVDDEASPAEARVEARYRLAEVQLGAGAVAEGMASLRAALEGEKRYDLAGGILRQAVSRSPAAGDLLQLYGSVARASEDLELLLDYLLRRSESPQATLAELREGVSVATELEDGEAVDGLLERARALAEVAEDGLAGALWIPVALAQRAKAAGDVRGAVGWTRVAAEAATDESRALELWRQAAALAAEGEDLEAAAAVYERLLERDPKDRKVWAPLLSVLGELGDEDRLVTVVINTVAALDDEAERNEVRLAHATFLAGLPGREHDAAAVLRAVLEHDRAHEEARGLLTRIFERAGYDDELADLLGNQLAEARQSGQAEAVLALSLRLGSLLERVDRERAKAVYREALELLPDDRELASALLALLGEDDDPRERVELLERPLGAMAGEEAAELAVRLADEWGALGYADRVHRVLLTGRRACPADEEVRRRLEVYYNDRGDWRQLAELLADEAERLADPVRSVALLRNAAAIHAESLGDHGAAASALAAARKHAPRDRALLEELVRLRAEAGERARAVEEVSEALDEEDEGSAAVPELLRLRAGLRMAMGQSADAVVDVEMAHLLVGEPLRGELLASLEAHRSRSADSGDGTAERAATLRIAELRREAGELATARELLARWLERARNDVEALRLLLELDEDAGKWETVGWISQRLIELETGEPQVAAALKLAEACERLGRPGSARAALERVHQAQPAVREVRDRLWALYEQTGAKQELGAMLMADAGAAEDPAERFGLLRRAGELLVASEEGAAMAVAPLEAALGLSPEDHETTILLADAYVAAGQVDRASALLEAALAGRAGKNVTQKAEVQARMARVAGAAGDRHEQLRWLNTALDSNKRDGFIAAELAELAMQLGELDTAFKALRVLTVSRRESPLSLAQAFLLQAKVAFKKGEPRQAVMWARKALSEDESLVEAAEFLKKVDDR